MTEENPGWFGLKSWFKPASSGKPDTLMESLQKYLRNPAHRDAFYKILCESDVYVINTNESPPERDPQSRQLKKAYSFKTPVVEHDGKQWVTVFSALRLLGSYAKTEVRWVSINMLEFFSIMPDVNVLLNPDSQYGAELTREEIQEIRAKYNKKYSA